MRHSIVILTAILLSLPSLQAQNTTLRQRLEYHVGVLASDSLSGRKAGSKEGGKAGDYIMDEMKAMKLSGYTQLFKADGKDFRNIIGRIEGTCDTIVVIGAHYDHLGTTAGKIYHGADDNASGTAALLELARNIVSSGLQPQYTLLFAAFDAEELGLYGSRFLASQLPADKVALMVSMDMVGWYKADNVLTIEGTGTLKDAHRLFADAASASGIAIREKKFETSLLTATDTQWFAGAGVPTLAITTGVKSPYHQPEDTADKIDYEGLAQIVEFMTVLTTDVATQGVNPSGRLSYKHGGTDKFSVGATAGLGRNYHHYTEGALEGKKAFACNFGLFTQYNVLSFAALRAAAVFEVRNAEMPDKSDIFGSSKRFTAHAVTVPVDFLLTTSNDQPVYAMASFGGYGSCVVGTELAGEHLKIETENINRMEYGLQWGLGANIYKVYITAHIRYALTDVFTDTATRNYCSYFTVGYRF